MPLISGKFQVPQGASTEETQQAILDALLEYQWLQLLELRRIRLGLEILTNTNLEKEIPDAS